MYIMLLHGILVAWHPCGSWMCNRRPCKTVYMLPKHGKPQRPLCGTIMLVCSQMLCSSALLLVLLFYLQLEMGIDMMLWPAQCKLSVTSRQEF